MFSAHYNFGRVESVSTEALGVPGKRIFRILIDAAAAAATLWVEKEQLYGVGMALKKMNETERPKKEGGAGAGEEAETGILDDTEILAGNAGENLEFKVSRLALAFGPGEEYITLFFNDERDEEEVTERAEEEPEEEEYGDGGAVRGQGVRGRHHRRPARQVARDKGQERRDGVLPLHEGLH